MKKLVLIGLVSMLLLIAVAVVAVVWYLPIFSLVDIEEGLGSDTSVVGPVDESLALDTRTVDLGDGVTMDFVWVPPGTFVMGDDHFPEEAPAHNVEITKGFWLGKCEVTNAQFRRFRPDHDSGMHETSDLNGDEQPVVMVNWHDANAFCEWLSEKAEGVFRLPSEAEWEYACRAGSQSQWSFGDSFERMGEYAWYDQNSGQTSHPVGQKKPSAWGLHDMHGNVWEWCADWYSESYYAQSPLQDPKGPETGEMRVYRGASWAHPPSLATASVRHKFAPDAPSVLYGFRVAWVLNSETGM